MQRQEFMWINSVSQKEGSPASLTPFCSWQCSCRQRLTCSWTISSTLEWNRSKSRRLTMENLYNKILTPWCLETNLGSEWTGCLTKASTNSWMLSTPATLRTRSTARYRSRTSTSTLPWAQVQTLATNSSWRLSLRSATPMTPRVKTSCASSATRPTTITATPSSTSTPPSIMSPWRECLLGWTALVSRSFSLESCRTPPTPRASRL